MDPASAPLSAPAARREPLVRALGLVKRYGPVCAVDGVGFEIGRGEVVGFLGPNGAGKSTTMRMLTGYLHPDEGRVEIGGEALDRSGLSARRRVGYLPESTPLYGDMRVDAYLDFVAGVRGMRRAERRPAVGRAVEACDLGGYARRRIDALSKGYRQRVGLAQALLPRPEVLILDEPTSGLDPEEVLRIRALVARLSHEATILLSTHVLSEVEEVCERAIILAGGRVVADGPLGALGSSEDERLLLVVAAPEDALRTALAALPGILELAPVPGPDDGRVRLRLRVDDRGGVAPRVAALVHGRGWALHELRHEVPRLEAVFLERTRRAGASGAGGAGA